MAVILLVEDHADTRAMYAEFLRPTFEVAEAADAERALDMMAERVPDLVITDLSLPGLDGFELIGKMRAVPALAAVPVICLSGFGGHAHELRAHEAGCDRILQKPCLPDELAREATALLNKKGEEGSQG
jgi:two-component system, chemotaxis family, CheB/CheR fusion protein